MSIVRSLNGILLVTVLRQSEADFWQRLLAGTVIVRLGEGAGQLAPSVVGLPRVKESGTLKVLKDEKEACLFAGQSRQQVRDCLVASGACTSGPHRAVTPLPIFNSAPKNMLY